LKIFISQSSVATQLRSGGIFNNGVIASLSQNVPRKKFESLSIFGEHIEIAKCDVFWDTV